MITTTIYNIRHSGAPKGIIIALNRKSRDDNDPIQFAEIVKTCGIYAALWCCYAEPAHNREWRLFAVRCARRVQHMLSDQCSIAAIEVAERFANGDATDDELRFAHDAALWAFKSAVNAAADAAASAAAFDASVAASDAACSAADAADYFCPGSWAKAWEEITADFLATVG